MEEWDAETILSTYTTTENHPSLIRVPPKPRSVIALNARTGLPVRTLALALSLSLTLALP